ncbi:MAG: ABC transporter permease, partial [Victivallales bacterium]|nr:ABC transporter permease [Victivallales bacterium]
DQAADLYGYQWDTATSIMCRVPDPLEIEPYKEIAEDIAQNIDVQTWQERNQMLFGTLKVEKNLMTFLMAFIVLVASFSIAGTLITVVVQKTREIGVMKALGFGRMMIARVFLFQGAIIGVIGTFLGTCLGLLVIIFRKQIAAVLSFIMGHDVFPAELYHLEAIPAQVTAGDLTFIVILSLAICVSAAVVPAIYASSLQPAKALQEDN